ncbi:MAG TPA: hypothetical protein VFA29_02790, partial [Candidatus Baltobacteraceae bacterium]|nr:hypothetical protein [Candidatus Baltobacteraceae bacterium]
MCKRFAGLFLVLLTGACSQRAVLLPANSPDAFRAGGPPASAANVSITVKVPSGAGAAQSISAQTGATKAVQNLSPGAPGCSGSNPLICTFTISANVGNEAFSFVTYSGPNGTGSQIAAGNVLQKVTAAGASISLTLLGTTASVTLALPSGVRQCDPAVTLPLYVMAKTSAGDTIIGAYGTRVSLTDSDTSGDTVLSASSVTSSAANVTLAYNGFVLQAATISPAVRGLPKHAMHSATLRPQQMMYVTDFYNGVNEFALTANGDVPPVRRFPVALSTEDDFLTPDCHLYVTINGGNSVDIIDLLHGSSSTLSGTNTGLLFPMAIGVDSSGKIYVSTQQDPASGLPGIEVFAAGASGDATPIAYLGGLATKIQTPNALTFDAAGNLFIADTDSFSGQPAIEVFPAGSTGNVAPAQFLYGNTVSAFGIAV